MALAQMLMAQMLMAHMSSLTGTNRNSRDTNQACNQDLKRIRHWRPNLHNSDCHHSTPLGTAEDLAMAAGSLAASLAAVLGMGLEEPPLSRW